MKWSIAGACVSSPGARPAWVFSIWLTSFPTCVSVIHSRDREPGGCLGNGRWSVVCGYPQGYAELGPKIARQCALHRRNLPRTALLLQQVGHQLDLAALGWNAGGMTQGRKASSTPAPFNQACVSVTLILVLPLIFLEKAPF